jgi:lysine-specific demethylase 3
MCRYCGREVCGDCFKRIKFITYSPPEATAAWAVVLQQRRTALKGKAFSLLCSKKREHDCVDFTPITRFRRTELDEALPAIEALAATAPPPTPVLREQLTYMPVVPPSDKRDTSTTAKEHPSHPIPFFDVDKLKDETFKALWAQGSPVVVHGLSPKLGPLWTPDFFIDTYDAQTCSIVDCDTDEVEQTTVGKFFSSFGKYQGRKNTWKLKVKPIPHHRYIMNF